MRPSICCCSGVAGIVLLGACSSYSPSHVRVGQTADEVVQTLGAPTGRYALTQGGTRLEYARGRHTYMVDLDTQSRVLGWQQVLTEANFNAIPAGLPREQLLLRLGHPSQIRGGGWQGGEVWSYRYESIFCQWFQISMIDERVVDPAYGPDPRCDGGDRVPRHR